MASVPATPGESARNQLNETEFKGVSNT